MNNKEMIFSVGVALQKYMVLMRYISKGLIQRGDGYESKVYKDHMMTMMGFFAQWIMPILDGKSTRLSKSEVEKNMSILMKQLQWSVPGDGVVKEEIDDGYDGCVHERLDINKRRYAFNIQENDAGKFKVICHQIINLEDIKNIAQYPYLKESTRFFVDIHVSDFDSCEDAEKFVNRAVKSMSEGKPFIYVINDMHDGGSLN